jgi:hypothetical protein
MSVLNWLSVESINSVELIEKQIECEKLAQLIDFVWLKENLTKSFFISKDVNVYSDYIEIDGVYCLIHSNPVPINLTAGNISISFSGGELIVSN